MDAFLFALGVVLVVATGASVLFTMVLPRRPAGLGQTSLWVNRSRSPGLRGPRSACPLVRGQGRDPGIGRPGGTCRSAHGLGGRVYCRVRPHAPADHARSGGRASPGAGVPVHRRNCPSGGPENLPLDVAAGAIWVVVVALQIAYLPALYAAFSQREGLVAMLESRAGLPAWGPESWPAISSLASSTPSLSSTRHGRSGRPA